MHSIGFNHLYSDAGIFYHKSKNDNVVIAVVYIDDSIFCGKNKSLVDQKKKLFMDKWECHDLGEVKEFLRMKITRKGHSIFIDQTDYLEKVIQRFSMENAKLAPTPLPTGWQPTERTDKANPKLVREYQTIIGSLLYIMIGTRPDISYAVTTLAKFSANPTEEHLNKAKYVIRYLLGTRKYALEFNGYSGKGLSAYTDSDWGTNTIKCRSVTGFFFKIANASICWRSHAQKTVALSSTEAEYMALSDTSHQAIWIQTLLSELGININKFLFMVTTKAPYLLGQTQYRSTVQTH